MPDFDQLKNYPVNLTIELVRLVEQGDHAEAEKKFDILLDQFENGGGNLNFKKYRCTGALSLCTRSAMGAGVSDKLMYILFHYFDDLSKINSWKKTRLLSQEILKKILAAVNDYRKVNFIDNPILQIRKDMIENIELGRSLSFYAKTLNISVTHLSRLYSTERGKSFQEELSNIRINKAIKLLKETNMTTEAIAWSIGIKSSSRFIKIFKTSTGHTPAVYRKRF